VIRGLVGLNDQQLLGRWIRGVGIGCRRLETSEAAGAMRGAAGAGELGVPHIELPVGAIIRVEGEGEQSEFTVAVGAEAIGDIEEDLAGGMGEVGDNHDAPGLFDDEEAVGLAGRCDDRERLRKDERFQGGCGDVGQGDGFSGEAADGGGGAKAQDRKER
jgi:hypothetical protein